jgi:MinD superfamily P-loop ATPase
MRYILLTRCFCVLFNRNAPTSSLVEVESLANMAGIPFLGCVPIDPQVAVSREKGQNSLRTPSDSPLSAVFQDIVKIITKPRAGTGDETAMS